MRIGNSHLSDSPLSIEHEDILIETLRKAMLEFYIEEAYANTEKRNLILLDLIRYRKILIDQRGN